MSESTAKASRQELRKAFGAEAVGVLAALSESCQALGDNQRFLRDQATALGHTTHSLSLAIDRHEERLLALQCDLAAFHARPFLKRLSWLFLGT